MMNYLNMKSVVKISILVIALFLFMIGKNTLIAQEPPHPPANGHGNTGNQPPPGGGAPLDGGAGTLVALSLLYMARKISNHKPD